MPAGDPRQGETWKFVGDLREDEYRIVNETEDWLHLLPTNILDYGGDTMNYPRDEFIRGIEKGKWEYVDFSRTLCPRCEERPKLEDDYLCWECRYGE